MRIGIEINNILRDINKQVIKYYKKEIDNDLNEKDINLNVLNVSDSLKFKSKKDKFNFMYVDYPYEIFGCAKTMDTYLAVKLNNWIIELSNREDDKYDVKLFSLLEEGLSIQSTYYFLSKIGCRVREILFPKNGKYMWDSCDVIITTNENIVKNKPKKAVVVLIRKEDNVNLLDKVDLEYNSLLEIIEDKNFISKVNILLNNKISFFEKIKKYFKI